MISPPNSFCTIIAIASIFLSPLQPYNFCAILKTLKNWISPIQCCVKCIKFAYNICFDSMSQSLTPKTSKQAPSAQQQAQFTSLTDWPKQNVVIVRSCIMQMPSHASTVVTFSSLTHPQCSSHYFFFVVHILICSILTI